ncbi:MAG: hypothetical protein ACYTHM_21365 [Planctomycetota bacterium]|jgi:hypothetical protein
MKAVRFTLAIAGISCLAGVIGLFIPMDGITVLATRYGLKGTPSGPFYTYLFRLTTAVITGCGVFYLFLAWDPRRHGVLVPVSGAAIVFVGVVLLATGFSSGMVTQVFLFDFLSCLLIGSAIIVTWALWGRGEKGK